MVQTTTAGRLRYSYQLRLGDDMNEILNDKEQRECFIEWCKDHYEHFNCYPGSFVYEQNGKEIDYPESVVWDAVEKLGFLTD
jgi:hypothetical protein